MSFFDRLADSLVSFNPASFLSSRSRPDITPYEMVQNAQGELGYYDENGIWYPNVGPASPSSWSTERRSEDGKYNVLGQEIQYGQRDKGGELFRLGHGWENYDDHKYNPVNRRDPYGTQVTPDGASFQPITPIDQNHPAYNWGPQVDDSTFGLQDTRNLSDWSDSHWRRYAPHRFSPDFSPFVKTETTDTYDPPNPWEGYQPNTFSNAKKVTTDNPNKQYTEAFSYAPVQNQTGGKPNNGYNPPDPWEGYRPHKFPVEEGGMGYGWGEGSSPWGEQTELETNIIPDWSSWIAPQFWENSAQDLDEFNLDGNPYDKRRDEYLSGMYGDLEADYQRGLENIKHAFAVRNDLESPAYHAALADYEDAYQRRKANITSQFAMGAAGADIDLHGRSMDNVFKSAMMSRGFYDSDMDRADQYYRDEMADMWNWYAAQEADWTRRQGYADDGMRLLLGYLTGSPFPTYGETNTGLSGLAKIMAERAENAGLQGSELGRVIYNALWPSTTGEN